MEQIFLIALRRNHSYQYLDLAFLVSRTVNKFLLFKLLSSWDFIMVALKTNALEFLETAWDEILMQKIYFFFVQRIFIFIIF